MDKNITLQQTGHVLAVKVQQIALLIDYYFFF